MNGNPWTSVSVSKALKNKKKVLSSSKNTKIDKQSLKDLLQQVSISASSEPIFSYFVTLFVVGSNLQANFLLSSGLTRQKMNSIFGHLKSGLVNLLHLLQFAIERFQKTFWLAPNGRGWDFNQFLNIQMECHLRINTRKKIH